jgi:HAD superfamily hydrolase (TIGR01490 family)
MQKTLVLFDFDGTLTRRDSLPDFLRFAVGNFGFCAGLMRLLPMLTAYGLGRISNDVAKENLIAYFLAGWEATQFEAVASEYSRNRIDRIIRPEALATLQRHLSKGHHVAVVSASIEDWLSGWCKAQDIDLIATRLEKKKGRLTGRFASRNCNRAEKVVRVREYFDLEEFDEIVAYGDSRGDRELLSIATQPFYRHFS